jgi:hypothetical protein
MADAVKRAYGLVESGVISDQDFREMTFTNAVDFWTATNRDFFKDTVVESAVNKLLAYKDRA